MQVREYQFLVICIDCLSWECCELRSWERVTASSAALMETLDLDSTCIS